MTKIDITKTELVWPGKYNDDGTRREVPRVSLPFQVIETVNESRATREVVKSKGATLFDTYQGKEGDTFEKGWKNKLIWGDNILVMGSLLDKFAGQVQLIYIDPPFATGSDFSFTAEIGDAEFEVEKAQSAIEEKAYRDTWGRYGPGRELDSWLEMMLPRLELMRDLLRDGGSICVHVDYRVSGPLRCLMDEVFGASTLRGWIVWQLGTGAKGRQQWSNQHNDLLWYSKGQTYQFNHESPELREPFADVSQAMHFTKMDKDGRRYRERVVNGKSYIYYADEGRLVGSVWTDCSSMAANSPILNESVGYPTQKPEKLLRRIIAASSSSGDLVADFFSGSGTTAAVAEKLERRWIACDLGRWGIHVGRKRMLGIEGCKPFDVLNLGRYERQYWQSSTFGEAKGAPLAERALYEYLAFVLKLYGAQPVAGMAHLHGRTGKAMVHIGAVDAPVTFAEIDAAVEECAKLKQGELHVLGWEWEMGLAGPNNEVRRGGPVQELAKHKGVKLMLLQIPREVMEQQAAAKGDVRFFELAYLEAEVKQPKARAVQVALKDFVIPNTELIPEEVRSKVKKWSDYIDYWAIDWDFQNDTFMQGWVAYRTRKERKLPLASDSHTYAKAGKYRILVKVIDIFGNDTSQAFDTEVK
jgi:adenine-specific DNA-methyltransferase